MNILVSHKFKKIGFLLLPLGFAGWAAMQLNYVSQLMSFLFSKGIDGTNPSFFQTVNIAVAVISFFSFLAGLYFIAFSKEKIEDEMVQRTRLDSFQFAAFIQITFVVFGFLCMLIYKDPGEENLLYFFIAVVALFWISFVTRLNYMLHFRIR